VERAVQTIKSILNSLIEQKYDQWQKHLNYVRCAYVNTTHSSTKETPHFIMHLSDFRFPFSAIAEPEYQREFYNYDTNYRNAMLKRAQITFDTVEQNLKIAHSTQKKYHDRTAKETEITIGSRVFLRNEAQTPGISTGLKSKFNGPYRVIKFDKFNNAIIKQIYGTAKTQVVHLNRLKLARERDFSLQHTEIELQNELDKAEHEQQQSPKINSNGETFLNVEKEKHTRRVTFAEQIENDRVSPPLLDRESISARRAAAPLPQDAPASPSHSDTHGSLNENLNQELGDEASDSSIPADALDEQIPERLNASAESQYSDADDDTEWLPRATPMPRSKSTSALPDPPSDPHLTRFKTGNLRPNTKFTNW
jgi:hypothetical protein